MRIRKFIESDFQDLYDTISDSEVEWTGNWDDMRAYEMAIIEAIS